MTSPLGRLAAAGITLPGVPAPLAAYVPAVRSGSLVFSSGQLPLVDGTLLHTGAVGSAVSVADGVACARQSGLNALAAVHALVGLDSVARIVKVVGFVACGPDFTQHPLVINGASELFGLVFDQPHARSAVGVASLPLGAPTEVEILAELA